MEWYLAARFFSMRPDDWDALGWHHQRALIEGLEDEGVIGDGAGTSSGTGVDEFVPVDLTVATPDQIRSMGFQSG